MTKSSHNFAPLGSLQISSCHCHVLRPSGSPLQLPSWARGFVQRQAIRSDSVCHPRVQRHISEMQCRLHSRCSLGVFSYFFIPVQDSSDHLGSCCRCRAAAQAGLVLCAFSLLSTTAGVGGWGSSPEEPVTRGVIVGLSYVSESTSWLCCVRKLQLHRSEPWSLQGR